MATQYSNPYNMAPPRIPTGYQPPYNGAPPIPQGMNVNPQQWQRGRWQFNPAYNPAAAQPAQAQPAPWVAGNQWSQPRQPPAQQQQSQPYNPYKRQPRAPSAEYLSYKLSDNPLGLTDMASREELYGSSSAQTPWVWAPTELEDEDEDEDEESDSSPSEGHGSNPSPSRPSSQSWHGYEGDKFPPSLRNKAYHASHHPGDPAHASGQHGSSTASASSSTRPGGAAPQTPERPAALQPTFSSKIVVTPNYYRSQSRASSAMGQSASHDSSLSEQMQRVTISSATPTPLGRHSSMPTVLESKTSPPNIMDSTVTHEPEAILSPLHMSMKPMQGASSRSGLTRHSSVPSGALDAIPEMPPALSASSIAAMRRKKSRSSRHTSPTAGPYDELDREPTPRQQPSRQGNPLPPPPQETRIPVPYSLPPAQSASSGTRARTGHGGGGSGSHDYRAPSAADQRRSSSSADHRPDYRPAEYRSPSSAEHRPSSKNPLPAPPEESRFVPPSMMSPPSVMSPSSGRKRRRRGYWNRRGDHLTADGYLIYAPAKHSYPGELRHYPDGENGYMNEDGRTARYSATRPELPESLPRLGRPPDRPYESFLQYVEV